MVKYGETVARPERCERVWLGASDFKEEVRTFSTSKCPILVKGVWRDSETDEILDIANFWGPGQPNGVRIQNCAGIWE